MNELFTCEMRTVLPSISTGGNGLPVPTSARPSVQRNKSAGVASACDVGFDSGKMIGPVRVARHLAHNLFGERAGLRRNAGQHCHFRIAHHVEKRDVLAACELPAGDVGTFANQRQLALLDAARAFDQQPVAIERIDTVRAPAPRSGPLPSSLQSAVR